MEEDEVRKGTCTVKRVDTGEQEEVATEKLVEKLDGVLHPGEGGMVDDVVWRYNISKGGYIR